MLSSRDSKYMVKIKGKVDEENQRRFMSKNKLFVFTAKVNIRKYMTYSKKLRRNVGEM